MLIFKYLQMKIEIILVYLTCHFYLGRGFFSKFGLSQSPNDVHFYLYSSPNFRDELFHNDEKSLMRSSYKKSRKTIFMVHGFWSNASSHFPSHLKNAYLKSIPDRNYIVVDWKTLATSPWIGAEKLYFLVYPEVLKNIPIVSQRIADFIHFLDEKNYTSPEDIHIIGHSLGAHVSGLAGDLIKNEYEGRRKVSRISGLDPAGPLFDYFMFQRKMSIQDALFVDQYHTSENFGSKVGTAHVDFYPNGGQIQPSCQDYLHIDQPFGLGACSHQFVVDIFAATISKNYTACECKPFMHVGIYSVCVGNCEITILAGELCPHTARGQFYFETSSIP